MKNTIYVYRVDPIDDFHLWMSPDDLLSKFEKEDFRSRWEYDEVLDMARAGARLIGWEGDMRDGPFVSVLPPGGSGVGSPFLIAWKQNNNGTSFVTSPYALPWLETENSIVVQCDIERILGNSNLTMKIVKGRFNG